MTKNEFLNMLEEIVEADPDTVASEQSLDDLEGWDSLAIVSFIAMVDNNFGLILSPSKIEKCETVTDLILLLDNKITE